MAKTFPVEILVVEDNRLNQKVIRQIFSKMGYSIDMAENGEIATQMARENSYDLILMDMEMPVMDGLTATRKIRRDLAEKDQPVIVALSANVMSERRQQCMDEGMNDFLSKPVRIPELTAVIEKTAQNGYA